MLSRKKVRTLLGGSVAPSSQTGLTLGGSSVSEPKAAAPSDAATSYCPLTPEEEGEEMGWSTDMDLGGSHGEPAPCFPLTPDDLYLESSPPCLADINSCLTLEDMTLCSPHDVSLCSPRDVTLRSTRDVTVCSVLDAIACSRDATLTLCSPLTPDRFSSSLPHAPGEFFPCSSSSSSTPSSSRQTTDVIPSPDLLVDAEFGSVISHSDPTEDMSFNISAAMTTSPHSSTEESHHSLSCLPAVKNECSPHHPKSANTGCEVTFSAHDYLSDKATPGMLEESLFKIKEPELCKEAAALSSHHNDLLESWASKELAAFTSEQPPRPPMFSSKAPPTATSQQSHSATPNTAFLSLTHTDLLTPSASASTSQQPPPVMPSRRVDPSATSTPYTDAAQTRKPARQGHIKRPMNAFMIWAQQQRHQIIAQYPGSDNAKISKFLGSAWKKLGDEEKAPYREEADRLKMLHIKEFPEYKYKPRKAAKRKLAGAGGVEEEDNEEEEGVGYSKLCRNETERNVGSSSSSSSCSRKNSSCSKNKNTQNNKNINNAIKNNKNTTTINNNNNDDNIKNHNNDDAKQRKTTHKKKALTSATPAVKTGSRNGTRKKRNAPKQTSRCSTNEMDCAEFSPENPDCGDVSASAFEQKKTGGGYGSTSEGDGLATTTTTTTTATTVSGERVTVKGGGLNRVIGSDDFSQRLGVTSREDAILSSAELTSRRPPSLGSQQRDNAPACSSIVTTTTTATTTTHDINNNNAFTTTTSTSDLSQSSGPTSKDVVVASQLLAAFQKTQQKAPSSSPGTTTLRKQLAAPPKVTAIPFSSSQQALKTSQQALKTSQQALKNVLSKTMVVKPQPHHQISGILLKTLANPESQLKAVHDSSPTLVKVEPAHQQALGKSSMTPLPVKVPWKTLTNEDFQRTLLGVVQTGELPSGRGLQGSVSMSGRDLVHKPRAGTVALSSQDCLVSSTTSSEKASEIFVSGEVSSSSGSSSSSLSSSLSSIAVSSASSVSSFSSSSSSISAASSSATLSSDSGVLQEFAFTEDELEQLFATTADEGAFFNLVKYVIC